MRQSYPPILGFASLIGFVLLSSCDDAGAASPVIGPPGEASYSSAVSAQAQQLPGEIHACYATGSGHIYRVAVDGAPAGCRGKDVGFSWSRGGGTGSGWEQVTQTIAGGHWSENEVVNCPAGKKAVQANGYYYSADGRLASISAAILPDASGAVFGRNTSDYTGRVMCINP